MITAESISDTFVWMRPNDLVWRYLIDEWLLGNKPPAFDIMFWNADGQGLAAQLALEMTEMSLANSLIEPGGCPPSASRSTSARSRSTPTTSPA